MNIIKKAQGHLIHLLGGYTKSEIKAQQNEKFKFEKQLKLIKEDLLHYDDRHHIEEIAWKLVTALERIKNVDLCQEDNFNNNGNDIIFDIGRSFYLLLCKRTERELENLLNIKKATYWREIFLKEYDNMTNIYAL